ncbi:hypothetical protein IP90_02445 [Luteimonas cucumeris]|uniref:Uncharacterized protein n=1 Tax=Luteimonas cucumeris TaxID=985012 RepID=A0A562L2M1_9GAMM|nr:hypothetical protein [Luteimonas cucumeris]TWI01885.1 hypothetical protein IP90_02445 [Luteimonas cucumeris]
MRPRPGHPPRSSRLRRWLAGAGLLTVLALAYGLSLSWFAHRLGDDVEKTLKVPQGVDGGVVSPR